MTTRITFTIALFLLALPCLLIAQHNAEPLIAAEQMPYFEGCGAYQNGTAEKRKCSNTGLINFISENIQYPEAAKSEGIEGTVFLSFIVNKRGQIESPKVLRDIGGGCGKEALRILDLMPDWEPAVNNDKFVSVKLNLPVTFSLNNENNSVASKFQIHWGALKGKSVSKIALEKNLNAKLLVRNEFGNDVDVSSLSFVFQRNKTFVEGTSTGKINSDLSKVVKKVKRGGTFTIVATILVNGEFMEIERQFKIVG